MNTNTDQKKSSVNGGCQCQAVRFEINLPSKWCAHCHCTLCQKAHGAGYVTWLGVDKTAFRLLSEDKLQWHESSPGARRGFCQVCGSSMLFESTRWADETHIALACIEGAVDRKPQAHVYYDSHVDWMPADENLTIVNVQS